MHLTLKKIHREYNNSINKDITCKMQDRGSNTSNQVHL
jgi:hypothetical protein